MRLANFLIPILATSVAAAPSLGDILDNKCFGCLDPGSTAIYADKDYHGDCRCLEAKNRCVNLDSVGLKVSTLTVSNARSPADSFIATTESGL